MYPKSFTFLGRNLQSCYHTIFTYTYKLNFIQNLNAYLNTNSVQLHIFTLIYLYKAMTHTKTYTGTFYNEQNLHQKTNNL